MHFNRLAISKATPPLVKEPVRESDVVGVSQWPIACLYVHPQTLKFDSLYMQVRLNLMKLSTVPVE